MDIKKMREDFATLKAECEKMNDKVVLEKRVFSDDENKTYQSKVAEMSAMVAAQENNKALAGIAFSDNHKGIEKATQVDANKFSKNQFNNWAKTGVPDAQFATITTATASGALLPKDVIEPFVPTAPNTFRQAYDCYKLQPMVTPTTRDISLPVATASSGSTIAENASAETENEPSLTSSILLHMQGFQSGSSWISNLELEAVDYDLFAELMPALNYSKELAIESNYMSSIAADGTIGTTATSTVSGIVYNDLVNLNRSLAKRYSFLKVIVLNKNAYIAAEKLVTTTGAPILNIFNPQQSELKYFNGTPVLWTDYLSGFGASNVVGFCVSMLGFRLRTVSNAYIARTVNYPPRPGQTGWNLIDYACVGYDSAALNLLKCPAS